MVEKDLISNSKYKNIRKSGNKMVKILIKLKIRNLSKFRFENLSKSKKIRITGAIRKPNFLILILE